MSLLLESAGLLADHQIRAAVQRGALGIEPFIPTTRHFADDETTPVLSYGLSSCGYDLRLGKDFRAVVVRDPKAPAEGNGEILRYDGPFLLFPKQYLLGVSVEYLKIPDNVEGRFIAKSSYARCGLIVNMTPVEPGWSGRLTFSLSNPTDGPIRLYPGEGIAQILFTVMSSPPEKNYVARGGKYQGENGPTAGKVFSR